MMYSKERFAFRPVVLVNAEPFDNSESAWFWFMQTYDAKHDGAKFRAGMGKIIRPCEPVDVLKIVDRLYRQRKLLSDHLRVITHYGRKLTPPNPFQRKEVKASVLWQEAFLILEPAFRNKGIVQ